MAETLKVGCARPTGGVVGALPKLSTNEETNEKKEVQDMIRIGKKAPDFTAPGYFDGKFVSVTLSQHLGRWVLLCFYPGDFTFV